MSRTSTNDAYSYHQGAATRGYTANGLNQYAGGVYSYDPRGNLTALGARAFTYDLENHLLTASSPTAVALSYDPLGRLQTSAAGGATTTFLYDGDNLVGEYDGSGNILARYVFGPGVDDPVVWYQGAGTASRQWLQADNQNSVIAWSGATGALTAAKGYDPYGQPSTWTGSRFTYTGQIAIPEARLFHYKSRVYDPGLGRFLQTDPVGYASDINPYAYAGNDPIGGSDPSGLEPPQPRPPQFCEFYCGTSGMNAVGATTLWGPTVFGHQPQYDFWLNGTLQTIENTAELVRGLVGREGVGLGHDYRLMNKVCARDLTAAEQKDLLSRFAVPNIYEMGSSLGNGEYAVTNQLGWPGGFVQTTFTSGGLTATNVTTPFHVFVGRIIRSVSNYGGSSYIDTHGFGNAGGYGGQVRDEVNQTLGPGLFNYMDLNAAIYAHSHYSGC